MYEYLFVTRSMQEQFTKDNPIAPGVDNYLNEMDRRGWELVTYTAETDCESRSWTFRKRKHLPVCESGIIP